MRSDSLLRRLARWFPLSWRVRYEDEFVALLEAAPTGWRTTMDVVQGCIIEWGHDISGRLVRVMSATGRFAGAVRLICLFLLAVALCAPVVAIGNAICSVSAMAKWTPPSALTTIFYRAAIFSPICPEWVSHIWFLMPSGSESQVSEPGPILHPHRQG